MSSDKCELLKKQFISESRLGGYENFNEYKENLLVSKSFYLPLSILEISLKNSIDNHFVKAIGIDWLFDKNFIKPQLQYKIDNAIKILNQNNKTYNKNKILNHNNLMSELSFGFWIMLLKKPYQQYLRYNDLKQIFPNLPSSKDKKINRHFIFTKLNKIRLFRNKVFHHDKIINKSEYKTMMNEIYEVLSYFDEKVVEITKELNKNE
jgi:hypothetical protein